MPYGLLGSPAVIPLPDRCWHAEAEIWRRRVLDNGGSVSQQTMAAVDQFCRDIAAAGLRGRFYRLNLFCGTGLAAALVPLYVGERIGVPRGSGTDTNNNFVAGDYNETGSSSGLTGNGSTKYLSTGLAGNSIRAPDAHLGVGLLQTESSAGSYKTLIGAVHIANATAYLIDARNGDRRCVTMGSYSASAEVFGDSVSPFVAGAGPLAAGRIIAAWPAMYRNGSPSGAIATASRAFGSATAYSVFVEQYASSIGSPTNARMGWYSIGLGMGQDEVRLFDRAIVRFQLALQRT